MFLKTGIFVNWGNIPQLEFDFGPINLFSGGNGSGKTTAADAIQTLMTAAHENLFNYNPGQDETTQKGRGGKQVRTLASYVLGCDDGSYARPHATDGYVAGVFHPTAGETGEAFTAVMCMRAHVDTAGQQKQARLDELMFLIVPGEQLLLSHFVRSYPDGKHIVPITEISGLLRQEFGPKAVEIYDKKGAYLRRLYGAVRGRKEAVSDREAKHAARTFSNFMAYKPVKSINEFVAREILEPKDLGDAIRNVSELMKTIHRMEADTRALINSIATLSTGAQLSREYTENWVERRALEYTEASRRYSTNHKAYLAAKQKQADTLAEQEDNRQQTQQCEQRRAQLHAQLVQLEAKRQGVAALRDKDQLEQAITQANRQLAETARPLLEEHQQLSRNIQAADKLSSALKHYSLAVTVPELESNRLQKTRQKVVSDNKVAQFDLTKLLGSDWIDTAPLEEFAGDLREAERHHQQLAEQLRQAQTGASVRDQVSHVLASLDRKRDDLQARLKQKTREIQRLENSKVNYPDYVEKAVAAITKQCPMAEPRVLCDFIEVLDPDWQMAIEGYIGGARYAIIVEQDYEADAIGIVRNMNDIKRNSARVIQGTKAQRDAQRLTLPQGSIVEVMSFSHKTAEFYLRASYGNVLQVTDTQALRTTARGITSDGLASGNYSLFRCDLNEADLVFGQQARERARQAKEQERDQLAINANTAEQEYQTLVRIFEQIEAVKPVRCAQVVETILALHADIEASQKALSNLDLSDFEALETQLTQLQTQHSEAQQQHHQLSKAAGGLQERTRENEKKVQQLADALDIFDEAKDAAEIAIERISDWQSDFNAELTLTNAEARATAAGSDFNFDEELQTANQTLEKLERELYQAVLTHNQQCATSDSILYDLGLGQRHGDECFQKILHISNSIELIRTRLKSNVLVDKHSQLASLKDSFNTAFVTNLCHSIYQAIGDGKRILDDLNKELEHHRFGADQERFYFDCQWVPEFQEYWQFFKELIAIPNLGDGTNLFDAELTDKGTRIRDKMLEMLLDGDEQVAHRELNRISDYRNYRNYEIYKEPEGKPPIALSQYGTGSGGQLETPAYIIRSAAVTSAFRFNEGSSHLRTVLVDEAFSKMDETRSREVINYLTETLGLQLVFIMPTSKSGPFLDLISNQFVFSKCPSPTKVGELNTRVLVDRKRCNQEKIKVLWANHRKTVRHQGMLDFMENL